MEWCQECCQNFFVQLLCRFSGQKLYYIIVVYKCFICRFRHRTIPRISTAVDTTALEAMGFTRADRSLAGEVRRSFHRPDAARESRERVTPGRSVPRNLDIASAEPGVAPRHFAPLAPLTAAPPHAPHAPHAPLAPVAPPSLAVRTTRAVVAESDDA